MQQIANMLSVPADTKTTIRKKSKQVSNISRNPLKVGTPGAKLLFPIQVGLYRSAVIKDEKGVESTIEWIAMRAYNHLNQVVEVSVGTFDRLYTTEKKKTYNTYKDFANVSSTLINNDEKFITISSEPVTMTAAQKKKTEAGEEEVEAEYQILTPLFIEAVNDPITLMTTKYDPKQSKDDKTVTVDVDKPINTCKWTVSALDADKSIDELQKEVFA